MEKKEPSNTVVKQPLWKIVWRFFKKLKRKNPKIRTMAWPSKSTPLVYPEKNENINSKRYKHSNVYSSTIYNTPDVKITQKPIHRWRIKNTWMDTCVCLCVVGGMCGWVFLCVYWSDVCVCVWSISQSFPTLCDPLWL